MGRNSRARWLALNGIAVAAACVALAVTGCGGGSSATGSTGDAAAKTATNATSTTDAGKGSGGEKAAGNSASQSKAPQTGVPIGEIGLKMSGLTAANTCKGKNISPAISWGKLPPGTAELAILAVQTQPVNGKLYYIWAIAGVDPNLSGLKAGKVPKGAVLGRNSAGQIGYSLCPKKSGPEEYVVSAYVLPHSLSPKRGFDPLALREQATRAAKEVGLTGATFPN